MIFDLDGVIVDTAEFHFLAWKRLADEEGIPFTREDNEALRGVSRRESLELLLKGRKIDEETAQAWMARKNSYYVNYLKDLTPQDILRGSYEFLQNARAEGYRIGLASASRNANTVLERLEISHLFDVIGDGYAVVNTKPASDLFLWVAGGLGVPARQCIVFEDAEAGVEAALRGGMLCVGIGPTERVGKAHLICQGLYELTIQQMQHLLAERQLI